MEKRVLIIGAGLSGLLCGKILSQRGFAVTILEQGAQAGGALQTFVREGIRFDTGFHSVGGLGPGEPLEQIFRPLGLMDLPWLPMEPDELIGCDDAFLRLSAGTEDERSHVLEPYQLSIWRLRGGGKTLADALALGQDIRLRKQVTSMENRTVTCADGSCFSADAVVSAIHPKALLRLLRDPVRKAWRTRIETRQDSPGIFTVNVKLRPGALPYINHSIFLSGKVMIHFGEPAPDGSARSLDLLAFDTGALPQTPPLRPAITQSLPSRPPLAADAASVMPGSELDTGALPQTPPLRPAITQSLPSRPPLAADAASVMPGSELDTGALPQTVMPGSERVSRALSLIHIAAERLPGLPDAVEKYWTSTPQTWERFTGTPGGSAYGICKRGPEDYLAPQTPLPWLFLTGQNLGLHGILGTSVSALNTCNALNDIL